MQENFRDLHVCRKRHVLIYYAHIKRLNSLKWRSLYDAGAIIENVYKLCMEEKKSGMKLSLNRVWDRTEALSGVNRSTTLKIVEEKKVEEKKAQDEQQQLSSTSKVSLDDFDQGVVRRTIASMYSLKKVLPTLDIIRIELKQSIGYTGHTGNKGRLRKDLYIRFAYTRCKVNQTVLVERQVVVLNRIRYLRMVRELREAGYTVVYTDETDVHTSHAVPK